MIQFINMNILHHNHFSNTLELMQIKGGDMNMALYGIYGRHEIDTCPWNNVENAKRVIQIANSDFSQMLPKYKIYKILGQYHSGLEHTFLWILDAEDPHLIQQFAVDSGMASFNEVRIVPLTTFQGVAEGSKKIHGL